MSSVSPTPSNTFSAPPLQSTPADGNAGQNNNNNNGGGGSGLGGPSSSLYLYTFLVTLALLLAISASIIIRSYLIRRRIRRMIAAGTWPEHDLPGSRRGPGVGAKPVMYEVWVGAEKGAPLAASFLAHPKSPASPAPSHAVPSLHNTPSPSATTPSAAARSRFAFWRRTAPSTSSAPQDAEAGDPAKEQAGADGAREKETEEGELQVAMLVAMPFAQIAGAQGQNQSGESELPPLELGVRTARARV